jgi:hypothetical protein
MKEKHAREQAEKKRAQNNQEASSTSSEDQADSEF